MLCMYAFVGVCGAAAGIWSELEDGLTLLSVYQTHTHTHTHIPAGMLISYSPPGLKHCQPHNKLLSDAVCFCVSLNEFQGSFDSAQHCVCSTCV